MCIKCFISCVVVWFHGALKIESLNYYRFNWQELCNFSELQLSCTVPLFIKDYSRLWLDSVSVLLLFYRLAVQPLTVPSYSMLGIWRLWRTTAGSVSSSTMWTWSLRTITIYTSATSSPNTWWWAAMPRDTSEYMTKSKFLQAESAVKQCDINGFKLLRQDLTLILSWYIFFFPFWSSTLRLRYKGYFGGVTAMTKEQFLQVNGFSNIYWGWGGEDDDLRIR